MRPLISIVIPVYNAEEYLEKCLNSVNRLQCPREHWEVIVVDNNSTDRSPDIIKQFPFKYCQEKKQGPSAARNLGTNIAKGKIVAFTDADVVVRADWVDQITEAFYKYSDIDGVQGCSSGINRNIWAMLYQKWYEERYLAQQEREYTNIKSLDTRNLAIRKKVLLDNKGFNEKYMRSEDNELGFRLYTKGYKIRYMPEIIVDHINPIDLKKQLEVKEKEYVFSFRNFMSYDKEKQRLLRPQYSRLYYKVILSNNYLVLKHILPFFNVTFSLLLKTMEITLRSLNVGGMGLSLYPLYLLSMRTAILKGKVASRIER